MAIDHARSHEPPVALPTTLMQPTLVARPFHREGWVYEEKYDGWRLVTHKADGYVRLVSRNGRDHTRRFPALAAALAALAPPTLILDGEVVIFDSQLVSRFEWLRRRDPTAVATPPIYMVFDLLRTGPHDLRREPLRARRATLERLVSRQDLIFPARRLAASGLTAWDLVQQRGYEGLIAKDEASPYVGGRTLSWLKVKQHEYRVAARGFHNEPSPSMKSSSEPSLTRSRAIGPTVGPAPADGSCSGGSAGRADRPTSRSTSGAAGQASGSAGA